MNICFEYLYRDAGNFKQWGSVVLSNRKSLQINVVSNELQSALAYGIYFECAKLTIPDLRIFAHDDEFDHDWHEYYSVSKTNDNVTDSLKRDIEDLIMAVIENKAKSDLNIAHYQTSNLSR